MVGTNIILEFYKLKNQKSTQEKQHPLPHRTSNDTEQIKKMLKNVFKNLFIKINKTYFKTLPKEYHVKLASGKNLPSGNKAETIVPLTL